MIIKQFIQKLLIKTFNESNVFIQKLLIKTFDSLNVFIKL
jgi:hypothetical protein